MSETYPEQQLSLPTFPGETVWYYTKEPTRSEANSSLGLRVSMPVDEIDLLPDTTLRYALWQQFYDKQNNERHSNIVFAEHDGSYSHTIRIPRGPLLSGIDIAEG